MTAPILEMKLVTRVHRRGTVEVTALRDVSLSVAAGELVAVMGPSGSGKSTLLNIAGGLDRPTAGCVTVCGTALGSLNVSGLARMRRRMIGYVFQDLNLLAGLTAVENVALPRELDGESTRNAHRDAEVALALVGVSDVAGRYPDALSGGEQQRVAIARALVGERQLILADEPTGALDSTTGEAILTVLRERCNAGVAGLLVTHEPRYAAWADRVVFLRDGAMVDQAQAPVLASALAPFGPPADTGIGA